MKTVNYYRDFDFRQADKLIRQAIAEDKGSGDVTSNMLIPSGKNSIAEIFVKQACIIAGLGIFRRVFSLIDDGIRVTFFADEGQKLKARRVIGEISGNTKHILLGERVSLNLLQRMSGIATATQQFKRLLGSNETKITDTRKTTPNMRLFEKLAVKIGGGVNHRMGLYDMVLIKDNHIEASGGIFSALEKIKRRRSVNVPVEIEVKDLEELAVVAQEGEGVVDRVMLDNFNTEEISEAVRICGGKFEIEVSGGVNLTNISQYKRIRGIDYISVGALTHSVSSIDIALDFIT